MAPMKATDRCDRCMAQAVATVGALDWLSALMFCGHCLREHLPALTALGVVIVNNRDESAVTW